MNVSWSIPYNQFSTHTWSTYSHPLHIQTIHNHTEFLKYCIYPSIPSTLIHTIFHAFIKSFIRTYFCFPFTLFKTHSFQFYSLSMLNYSCHIHSVQTFILPIASINSSIWSCQYFLILFSFTLIFSIWRCAPNILNLSCLSLPRWAASRCAPIPPRRSIKLHLPGT